MKDRTLRRLHAIITRCIVYPQILNPIYLKYNKLIGKSQVLKFSNWTRCVQFKNYQTFLPPSYSFANPFLIKYSATSILPTFTLANSRKYLSRPKSYKIIFLPEYNNFWRMPASLGNCPL